MNKRLFVASLPFNTTADDLKTLFAECGNVISAEIIMDRDSGKSKGFGFVEMETIEDVKKAITKFNDFDFGGRKLIVNIARPKEDHPRNSGGFRGRVFSGGFGKKRGFFGERREGGRGNFGRDRKNSGRGGFRSGRH